MIIPTFEWQHRWKSRTYFPVQFSPLKNTLWNIKSLAKDLDIKIKLNNSDFSFNFFHSFPSGKSLSRRNFTELKLDPNVFYLLLFTYKTENISYLCLIWYWSTYIQLIIHNPSSSLHKIPNIVGIFYSKKDKLYLTSKICAWFQSRLDIKNVYWMIYSIIIYPLNIVGFILILLNIIILTFFIPEAGREIFALNIYVFNYAGKYGYPIYKYYIIFNLLVEYAYHLTITCAWFQSRLDIKNVYWMIY